MSLPLNRIKKNLEILFALNTNVESNNKKLLFENL